MQNEMDLQNRVLDSIGRMTDGVVHQFNNQLTVIQGYSDMLLRQMPADSPAREAIEEIDRAARRATGLTGKLLAFSGRQVLQPRTVDLASVVDELAGVLAEMLGGSIRLTADVAERPIQAFADPVALERSVLSLIENAVEAIAESGQITLQASARDDPDSGEPMACIRVADTGAGMDRETLNHIFEPFFSTKSRGNDSGMSLAVLHGFVHQSGGKVRVESDPDQGTEMTICLPLARTGQVQLRPLPGSGTESVVVAMDSAALTDRIGHWLERFGYSVQTASSPAESAGLVMRDRGGVDAMIQDLAFHQRSEQAPPLQGPRGQARVLYVQTRLSGGSGGSRTAVIPWTHRLMAPFGPFALAQCLRSLLDAPQRTEPATLTGKAGEPRAAAIGQWLSESETPRQMLTEQEWNLVRRHLPKRRSSRKGGRKLIDNRLVLEGIAWVLRHDRRWEDLPEMYPSARTCRRRLHRWKQQGIWDKIRPIVLAETTPAEYQAAESAEQPDEKIADRDEP